MPQGSYPRLEFLWPALAAASASGVASALAEEFAHLAAGVLPESELVEPQWTTPNRLVIELPSMRLRDFSTDRSGVPVLVCAPFALHGATIVDLAPDHSLIAALRAGGLTWIAATDWRSATADMRLLSIDSYLADLHVAV